MQKWPVEELLTFLKPDKADHPSAYFLWKNREMSMMTWPFSTRNQPSITILLLRGDRFHLKQTRKNGEIVRAVSWPIWASWATLWAVLYRLIELRLHFNLLYTLFFYKFQYFWFPGFSLSACAKRAESVYFMAKISNNMMQKKLTVIIL